MAWSADAFDSFHAKYSNKCANRYQSHINCGRRLILMLQLAGTLVIDLRLSSASATVSSELANESSLDTYTEDIHVQRQPNLDESRALLGLYFMHSVYDFCHNVLAQCLSIANNTYQNPFID